MSRLIGPAAAKKAISGVAILFVLLSLAAPQGGPTASSALAAEKGRAGGKGAGGGDDGRPNVLVVMTDDQRDRGTMGVMDFTRRLFKKNGIEYPRAFSTTPVCCPSRGTIFTGQYVHNHELRTNGENDLPQFETVQRYLDEAGYRTAIFGKFLNAWNINQSPPHFDRWSIYKNSSEVFGETAWNDQGKVKNIIEYPIGYIQRQASGFLRNYAERRDNKPWLMFLTPPSPHLPATPEREYNDLWVGKYKPTRAAREKNRSDKPHYVNRREATGEKRTRRLVHRQLRSLVSVDDLMRQMNRQMNRLEETKNTLVLYLSDNGFLWAEHGMLGSLRSKANPYSESIRVPMFLRWPKKISGASSDSRFVSNADVAPTILDAAKLDTDIGLPMDGQSLLDNSWSRRKMFLEFFPTSKSQIPRWNSVRTDEYQYVEYYRGGEITFREYYDMKKDPWQLVNLFKDGRPRNDPSKSRLHKKIKRYEDCIGNECP